MTTLERAILQTARNDFHDKIARPRAYPDDSRVVLQTTDGAAPDTFGGYVALIPRTTFDFGDSPNRYRIMSVNLEDIPANDTYVLEFYRSYDDVLFTPVGNIRFIRSAPFTRSFEIYQPTRPLNADAATLYARLKDAAGAGTTISFSLRISRFLPPIPTMPISSGVWPTG